ncbi:MAG: type III pantothenate kinase [Odoribacteraceae bacterium]|jgi:type III pantothenate kinase|nr:type III pantothenate kinase [Odoribacteraceae bacterium]
MNLVVDIGNTRGKYAIFHGDTLIERGDVPLGWYARALAARTRGEAVDVLLASTGSVPTGTRERLREVATSFREASTALPLPLQIAYESPDTLGIDRVAGCVAGIALYPGRALLIVDAGTAITFNFVSKSGVLLGGNISPGPRLRYRALHAFTAHLPLEEQLGHGDRIGKNTRDALREGVTRGVLLEIQGYARTFLNDHPDGILLLTGGDAPALRRSLPDAFHFEEHLVMTGLNQILEHQKKRDEDAI